MGRDLAGAEIASFARYIYVPEEWERQQRAASTRNLIIQIAISVVFAGLLLSAAVGGMIAWSRGRYAPRLFLAAAAMVLAASIVDLANGWPTVVASLSTSAPLAIQLLGIIAVGFIGVALVAAVVGLALGALPHRLGPLGAMPGRAAVGLGIAAGPFRAPAAALAATLRPPGSARIPAGGIARTAPPV